MAETVSVCVNEVFARHNSLGTYDIEPKPIGAGGNGVIYRARRNADGKTVALKFFGYTDRLPPISDVNNEIVLMMHLVGVEGVLQIESIFYDTPLGLMPNKKTSVQISYPVIVMETLSGGDLLHKIDDRARGGKPISERNLAAIFKSAMIAIDTLHKKDYIHRDIKLANMLLVSEEEGSAVKLIDFGSLTQVDRASRIVQSNEPYGTAMFMAPESLGPYNREYSTASDIWQSGCVLYYMLCADSAFKNRAEIKAGKFVKSPRLSAQAHDLISRMLAVKPKDRILMEDILNHPWLTGDAPEHDLGREYSEMVKQIVVRKKLRHLLEPQIEAVAGGEELDDSVFRTCQWTGTNFEAESRYYFNLFDGNGDGNFDKKDLQRGFAQLIRTRAASCLHTADLLNNQHQNSSVACGGTNCGTVTCGTTAAACTAVSVRYGPAACASVDEIFDVMDTDKSGLIDFAKFFNFYAVAFAV